MVNEVEVTTVQHVFPVFLASGGDMNCFGSSQTTCHEVCFAGLDGVVHCLYSDDNVAEDPLENVDQINDDCEPVQSDNLTS